uniref:Aldehyde dehydrogenase domain-containing protein n=1 Tax=Leptobrachium leishanense TaxID=445787 RepID=A0A8C5QPM8_9ANUR
MTGARLALNAELFEKMRQGLRARRGQRRRGRPLRARERWYAAFRADLGKPAMEVELTELLPVLGEAATPSPRGRCLIIGPWNYPLNTVLGPLVSAVAAGNTAIVIADVFEPTEVAVVEGGVATATRLLALPFDHIFFTGSPAVGQVVMAAASRHLALRHPGAGRQVARDRGCERRPAPPAAWA